MRKDSELIKEYTLPDEVKVGMWYDGEWWNGELYTPDDPLGKICQVAQASELECLGVLMKMYFQWRDEGAHRLKEYDNLAQLKDQICP